MWTSCVVEAICAHPVVEAVVCVHLEWFYILFHRKKTQNHFHVDYHVSSLFYSPDHCIFRVKPTEQLQSIPSISTHRGHIVFSQFTLRFVILN